MTQQHGNGFFISDGVSLPSHNVLKTINVLKHSINGSAVKVPSVIARCWQCVGQYFIKNYTLWQSGGKRLKSPARLEKYSYLWGMACCLIRIVDVHSSGYSGHLAHIQWTPAMPPPPPPPPSLALSYAWQISLLFQSSGKMAAGHLNAVPYIADCRGMTTKDFTACCVWH